MPTSDTLSGYARAADDWYVEPREATRALLAEEHFAGTIWDPACGEGRILEEVRNLGLECWGSDIVNRGADSGAEYGISSPVDFLGDQRVLWGDDISCIITNPPYRLLTPFIERSLKVARWKVAIFCKLLSLEGIARLNELYRKHPLARVYVFADRQSCPPGGGVEAKDTKLAHCWQVYEHGHKGPPTLHWLNTREIA